MNLSQCLNPGCLCPNSFDNKFCNKCGSQLLLGDRYRPIRYIGEGGFGRTFEAIDQHRLNSRCVIKQFLPLQQGSNALAKATELFRQEAIQLCELKKHSQIPDLLAFFQQEGRLYLVQEFIEGQDLAKEIKQNGRWKEVDVRQFLRNLLPVLLFIHERNIIHRDIKLDNIIQKPNGSFVLIDFGVSKQLSASIVTKMGTITGTIGYAPPEQLRGIVSPASDIYGLGVTALRLLTGCLPEERNGSLIDEIYDPLEMEWKWREWLDKNNVLVSDAIAEILDKMVQDKVRDRFQTANEVIESLSSHIPLISVIGVDYTRLRDLLETGKWKEADQETYRIILKICDREKERYLELENIQNLPCEDIYILDQLWLKYSNGHFGFSVIKQIWDFFGGNPNLDHQRWEAFGYSLGWRIKDQWMHYDRLKCSLKSPKGQLPRAIWSMRLEGRRKRLSAFMKKVEECNLLFGRNS